MSRFIACIVAIAVLLGGSWQAEALKIGLIGSVNPRNNATAVLGGSHSIEFSKDNAANVAASDYDDLDVVLLMRRAGNQNLVDFVSGGGLLITSVAGATDWAVNTESLLGATSSSTTNFIPLGGGTVTITADGDAAGFGDAGSFISDGNTTLFRTFTAVDSGAKTLATRDPVGPDDEATVISAGFGPSGGGVVAAPFNWDNPGGQSQAIQDFILNAVDVTFQPPQPPEVVPEPSTLALFSLAILGVLGYGWRRRKQGGTPDTDNAA